ncbi:arginyl-tRNA synthetase [Spiromyces aspiralis]|uniref:Arginyl-tRNA synthetase n=1 Tax=Spiromyces aspiralis TaxID=68401 RepID=A0ACC1HWJ2_9FUNG|nr:arginyl-tRNA synthetase [Spiromyces aspiralis]
MFDRFKDVIADQLAGLTAADRTTIFESLQTPRQAEHGDFAIAVPRLRLKGNPVQLAKELSEKFQPNDLIASTNSSGPFVNFSINKKALLADVVKTVYVKKKDYGANDSGKGKRVIVEFSSPNIAKPFHAGHLRSTIIGHFICNLYKANGWETISMNYLGDWGKQYGLLAIGFEKFGSEEKLLQDPIKHLFEVYVKINEEIKNDSSIEDQARTYFKRMEDGDEAALALWKHFRDLSIKKYKQTYARLGINFDVYSGESQVTESMQRAMSMLEEAGLVEESEGARLINLETYKCGKALVQKRDGATLYLTRDIGAAIERYEKYEFDRIIYVVASQQDFHLKQLFKILELLELPYADRFMHVNYGLVKGMSTRKGTVVFLEDMLDSTKERMHEVMKQNEEKYQQIEDPEYVADVVSKSAIYIQDFSARRIKDYEFDWDRVFSFEGDTGPYLQYAHSRLCSMERRAPVKLNPNADLSLLVEPVVFDLITLVAQWPDVIKTAMQSLEPSTIVTYALKLSHEIARAWESLWVVNQPQDIAEARLLLYWTVRTTLGNALTILGLEPLERM